ncbi:MAG: RNA polymerase sigma factor [Bacteroidota bacterium]
MKQQQPSTEDQQLIQACILGQRLAQKKLYLRYMPAMYNRAVRMLADAELAKDVIQEVFAQVFKDLKRFRGTSTLGAWIKRITINKCIDELKQRKRFSWVTLEQQGEWEQEEVEVREWEVKRIHKAIQELPEGCRTVLNLFLLEGYQHQEIAEILNISLSTSKSQYHRAKKLLRQHLKLKVYE